MFVPATAGHPCLVHALSHAPAPRNKKDPAGFLFRAGPSHTSGCGSEAPNRMNIRAAATRMRLNVCLVRHRLREALGRLLRRIAVGVSERLGSKPIRLSKQLFRRNKGIMGFGFNSG